MGVSAGGAAAEGAKDAGEAEAGKGATEAAAGGLADAGVAGGAGALTAGIADAGADAGLAAGVGDATADLATTAGGLSAADTTAGLAGEAAGAGGAGAATSSLASGAIPELTVTGAAPAAAGGSSALAPIAASGLAAAGAGGGGSGVPGSQQVGVNGPEGAQAQPADQAPPSDIAPSPGDTGGGFLPATGDSSVQALSPDAMQSLGITPAGTTNPALTAGDTGAFDPSSIGGTPDMPSVAPESLGDQVGDKASELGKWLSNPKNAATAGLLGLSAKNALTQPGLPGADKAAQANAAALSAQALPVVQSGGTATPEWASQKASIDATVDDEIKQQTQAIMQAAASSGEGGQNSGIVQQQIAAMTQKANLNRQQLYAQAQQQNVSAALSALSGGDSTLTSIGSTQLQQSEQAQQLAAQTAEMALLLQTGQKLPGQGSGLGPANAGS